MIRITFDYMKDTTCEQREQEEDRRFVQGELTQLLGHNKTLRCLKVWNVDADAHMVATL